MNTNHYRTKATICLQNSPKKLTIYIRWAAKVDLHKYFTADERLKIPKWKELFTAIDNGFITVLTEEEYLSDDLPERVKEKIYLERFKIDDSRTVIFR